MASAENRELLDRFEEFYRTYYRDEIGRLAREYPGERKSLYVDWSDLYRFDTDVADDYLSQPEQMQEYAEEALRLYDLPVDVSLGQAHVRVQNLPEVTEIRALRSRHVNRLVSVQGIVRKATGVRPKVTEAAFECQRCGTLTRIPQAGGDFREPHECQGCERQGPFRVNHDQSEFIDAQKLQVQESPEGLRGGETPEDIDVNVEDDLAGQVSPGDHVTVTGVLHLEQQGSERDKSTMFDVYMEGVSVVVEDEEFEEMDITDEDEEEIRELAAEDDVYEQMIGSIAPSIYGYEEEKHAIVLQLFSGVTKHLPDGSRTRGDFHILLIGDPGTGKCVAGDTRVTLSDGAEVPIRDLVERNLDDPKPVDDGVYDHVDLEVPSVAGDGTLEHRRATKVWKREAPDRLYRIRTASGREIAVTPSHPLYVPSEARLAPVKAEELREGDFVAAPRRVPTEGADALDVDYRRSRAPNAVRLDSPDERNGVATDGGQSADASTVVPDRLGGGPSVEQDVGALRVLAKSDVRWDAIESIETVEPDDEWVYDLEVAGTHNYLTNGLISHNSALLQYIRNIAPRSVYTSGKGSSAAGLTAAAVRDDFAEGNQWTLEAGALVLADRGVAAIDELDKMDPNDRSAMHEALESQTISISKAGINATLKSRCSLLGAANPKYGRFDQYEPIPEQIELEPALVSRFDLIFTVTDQPDPEQDRELAEHILETNYAGELTTRQAEAAADEVGEEVVEGARERAEPAIEPELLRKYVAYAKRNVYPTLTGAAREAIREFYVDLRSRGADEDAPVPVTARKLEALVRLAEASARVRLSETVTRDDAERVIALVRSSLENIGVDPETGEFDADVVETGTSKTQRDRIRTVLGIIQDLEDDHDEGAPVEEVMERADEIGIDESKAEHHVQKLKREGDVYEPAQGYLRTT